MLNTLHLTRCSAYSPFGFPIHAGRHFFAPAVYSFWNNTKIRLPATRHNHGVGWQHNEVFIMFGIGLPEMLLIMALALIVIGPDKLPDLARSLAKGLLDLKKAAESLKTSFSEEGNPLDEIRPELEEAAKSLKNNLLDTPLQIHEQSGIPSGESNPAQMAAEAYQELMKQTGNIPGHNPNQSTNEVQEEAEKKKTNKSEDESTGPETGKIEH